MSTTFERPPDDAVAATTVTLLAPGGLSSSPASEVAVEAVAFETATVETATVEDTVTMTLDSLPLGAHLVLCCRKDWRTATVVRVELDKITLSVNSPTGRTYRMRRPPDAPLAFDGHIPLLPGAGRSNPCWRTALARYDVRW
ncbi:MAG: hypothetical protein QOD32_3410 [Pyrinomonadaceae bacterium]|nr:hypothetical protein [Pyrinomonadaceae bacterium]